MNRSLFLFLSSVSFALAACSDGFTGEPSQADAAVTEPSDAVAANAAHDAGVMADASFSCNQVLVYRLDPSAIAKGTTPVIHVRGCGLAMVTSIDVSVSSVTFTHVSDAELTFTAPAHDASVPLPYNAEVDVRVGPTQVVQAWLEYLP